MAGIIEIATTSGLTLNAYLRNLTGQIWNGAAFENFSGANLATYAMAMTEQETMGYYTVSMPAATAGVYSVQIKRQAGGSPAQSDVTLGMATLSPWDGTAFELGFSTIVEGSYTLKQFFRLMGASLLGKLSGAATTTVVIRDTADAKDRVTATVDSDGNRTAVTLDAS